MITISYVNFWNDHGNIQDRWFSKFIESNFKISVKEINPINNPDIVICSCMGNIQNVVNIKSKCKIFFYGENLNRYPPYNNEKLLEDVFDLIIGFKNTNIKKKFYRLPLWITYYSYYNFDNDDNILNHIQSEYDKHKLIEKNYCALIARHDRGGQRTILYDEVSKYTKVFCPSNFKNNTKKLLPGNIAKKNFLKNIKFNICPENSSYDNYFTEKIFESLECGCIPIYWSIDYPEKDILNEKSYCFIRNINDKNEIQKKIKSLIERPEEFIVNDLFIENAEDIIKKYYNDICCGIKKFIF